MRPQTPNAKRRTLNVGDRLALAPQVLAGFIHVVTDERRFAVPLSVEAAVERASNWYQHFDHGIERFVVFVTAATF